MTVAVLAPVCFAVPVWLRGAGPYMQTARSVGYAGRYAATPMLMLISAVLVLAGHLSAQPERRAHVRHRGRGGQYATLGAIALCCLLLVPGWATDFRDRNGRSRGPAWESRLPVALAQCHANPPRRLVAVVIDPPDDRVVLYLPGPRATGAVVGLCARLPRARRRRRPPEVGLGFPRHRRGYELPSGEPIGMS